MAAFQLRIDLDGEEKLSGMMALLSPATFERALKGGMQYAAKATPPAISKAVGARYNWKARDIKNDTRGPRFSDGGRTATITLSRRARTAAVFGGRKAPKGGYTFTVIRGERQTFAHAFEARGKQGILLPFYRTKPNTPGGGRYPIDVIHGASLGSVFMGNSRFGAVMKQEVEERMRRQFIVGIDRELSRKSRGF
jgi:hypothetical protein